MGDQVWLSSQKSQFALECITTEDMAQLVNYLQHKNEDLSLDSNTLCNQAWSGSGPFHLDLVQRGGGVRWISALSG